MKTAAILLTIGAGIAFGSPAQAQGKDPPGVNPTHFVCYRVSQSTKLKPAAVKLKDQFGAFGSKIGNPLFLCAPVSKNGEEVKDSKTHLTCYSISAKNASKKVKALRTYLGSQVLHCRRLGRAVPALDHSRNSYRHATGSGPACAGARSDVAPTP